MLCPILRPLGLLSVGLFVSLPSCLPSQRSTATWHSGTSFGVKMFPPWYIHYLRRRKRGHLNLIHDVGTHDIMSAPNHASDYRNRTWICEAKQPHQQYTLARVLHPHKEFLRMYPWILVVPSYVVQHAIWLPRRKYSVIDFSSGILGKLKLAYIVS
ncbi:LOW QUALITY PROTEIN: hypothetical protein ACHAWO_011574 [Cyclotella atomus]|uniref:Uncharacterized protein n=1 Tax=Cyclotella atomus TaxID=382360 RepID=A0ABD3NIZ5_9STRA